MKTQLFTALIFSITLIGCQKKPDESKSAISSDQKSADTIQFEVADQKIGYFLNKVDNPRTSLEERKQIICKDYPDVYAKEYSPALLKSSPKYTPPWKTAKLFVQA